MRKDFEKRFWIAVFLTSVVLIWLDFFVGSILVNKKPLWLGKYDLSFLGYSGFVYPFISISFWIVPLILYPDKWRFWIFGMLTMWTLNDLLWFLVRPDEWIRFWIPRGEILFRYHIIGNSYIEIVDYEMGAWVVARLLLVIYLYRKLFREGRALH